MAQTEQTRRTLTQLHKEVKGFDEKIKKQRGIVDDYGRGVIKEFSPAQDTQPEDVIIGVYNVLQRRLELTERIKENALPYLEERRTSAQGAQDDAVLKAREAYEGIQTLARLGVCSPEGKDLLEEALSRLPEDIAIQIRTSPIGVAKQQVDLINTQQDVRQGFFARILRRGRRQAEPDTQIINSVPQPLNANALPHTVVVENRETVPTQQVIEKEKADKNPVPGDQRVPFQGEIPDVSIIVGKKAILQQRMLTAIFEATVANDNFTKIDYAQKLFEQDLREGKVTEEKAVKMFVDSLQWVQRKAKISGYEVYHVRQDEKIVYRISARKGSEDIQKPSGKELSAPQDILPALPAETPDKNEVVEIEFPDGRFLGKEEDSARKIYAAIIDFSLKGKLPAGEDLIKTLFTQDIASGAITQNQAHTRIRDGLSRLRGKLKNTGVELVNKGTAKFPFYKIEIVGQIPDTVWNPVSKNNTTVKSADRSSTKNDLGTVIGSASESISLPSPDMVAREGSIRRRYYEFLLARKTDGITTSIEEEADYLYGGHSKQMIGRVYALRQQLNSVLEPLGIHVGAEKRNAGSKEEGVSTETLKGPALTPELESAAEIPEPQPEIIAERETDAIAEPTTETQSEHTAKTRLRGGERKTLQILEGTSEDNTLTTDEITAKFFPDKKIRRDDTITVQTFIAGLKSFSLPGTGIQILHPLTKDGNPVLNRHYLKLPEGKRLEDIIDFESGSPSHQQTTSNGQTERIPVPISSVELEEGTPTEIPVTAISKSQEAVLPHFKIDESEMGIEFSGRKSRLRFADQWEVFKRIAAMPNKELTPHELAGLDPETHDIRALERAENHFRHFITLFEENPKDPQIFIITGGNRYPRFTFRASVEFVPDTNINANSHIPQR